MKRDFLIQDGRIVFEMDLSQDGEPVKRGILSISPEKANQHSEVFEALLKIAPEFKRGQKTL